MSDISRQLYKWEKEGIAMYEQMTSRENEHKRSDDMVKRAATEYMAQIVKSVKEVDLEEAMIAETIRVQKEAVKGLNEELWEALL